MDKFLFKSYSIRVDIDYGGYMSQFTTKGHKTGVIILLDVLGTKGIWRRLQPKDYVKKWLEIRNYLENIQKIKNLVIVEDHLFSDTVIISMTPFEDNCNALQLLGFASLISQYLLYLGFEKELLFRGVISYGDYYTDKEIIIGQAIDEAAEYYEQPNWMGISMTPQTAYLYKVDEIQKVVRKFPPNDYVKYDITYNRFNKDSKCKETIIEEGFAINWLLQVYVASSTLEKVINKLKILKDQAPSKAKSKYDETIKFIEYCENLKNTYPDIYRTV